MAVACGVLVEIVLVILLGSVEILQGLLLYGQRPADLEGHGEAVAQPYGRLPHEDMVVLWL